MCVHAHLGECVCDLAASPMYPLPNLAMQSVAIFAAPASYKYHKNRQPRCARRRLRAPAGREAATQTGRMQP